MGLRVFRLIFWIFCSCFASVVFCQSEWQRVLNNEKHDGTVQLLLSHENIYTIHRHFHGGSGSTGVIQELSKWTLSGDKLWQRTFSDGVFHVFEGPASILDNGDIVVVMIYYDTAKFDNRIIRLNPDAEVVWETPWPILQNLDFEYGSEFYKILQLGEDEIRMYFRMANWWPEDPTTVKNGYIILNRLGEEIFRHYFDTGGEYHWLYNITTAPGNRTVRAYRPTEGALFLTFRIESLDSLDNMLWRYQVGPEHGGGSAGPLCTDPSGNVYFTWKHDTTGDGGPFNQYPSIVSLDLEGNFRWMRHFGDDDSFFQFFSDIIYASDGRIIACGEENNVYLSGKARTGWVVCVDTSGQVQWERRYVLEETGNPGNTFRHIAEAPDGGLILFGELSPPQGGTDAWLIKTDNEGCLIPGCGLYNFITLLTHTEQAPESTYGISIWAQADLLLIDLDDRYQAKEARYLLASTSGIVMATGTLHDPHTELSIADLPAGIYFLTVTDPELNESRIFKFFKP